MHKRSIAIALIALVAVPVLALGAQRFGRGAGMIGTADVEASQVWRLTTLTLNQREQLRAFADSILRNLRAGDRPATADLIERRRKAVDDMRHIVGDEQLDRARSMPRGALTVEELIYYPVTSLSDLDRERKAKIAAVFQSLMDEERDRTAGGGRR